MKKIILIILKILPAKIHLSIMYLYFNKKLLSLKNPKEFNEKIQWLKLHDFKEHYTKLVDKYEVRKYVQENLGEQYLINLLGVYNTPKDIDWDILPDKFVIKWNHGSGSNIIVKDKTLMDINQIKLKLNKMGKRNWYWYGREKPYKNIEKKIIIEEYLEEDGKEINDYKIHCFSGVAKYIQVDIDRFSNHRRNIYDRNWNLVEGKIQYINSDSPLLKPRDLSKMIKLAEILAKEFKYVRIDFYYVNEKIYFGEITFYHGSGFEKITPLSFALELGSYIE